MRPAQLSRLCFAVQFRPWQPGISFREKSPPWSSRYPWRFGPVDCPLFPALSRCRKGSHHHLARTVDATTITSPPFPSGSSAFALLELKARTFIISMVRHSLSDVDLLLRRNCGVVEKSLADAMEQVK